ncbi:hypothetical protein ACFVZR_34730 [Streptomyces sp. NPDC058316]|uniref:hypothetical protein n=1 Tax=unclassified Streptomyces TaxID=2593676 RepID=UPI00331DF128
MNAADFGWTAVLTLVALVAGVVMLGLFHGRDDGLLLHRAVRAERLPLDTRCRPASRSFR